MVAKAVTRQRQPESKAYSQSLSSVPRSRARPPGEAGPAGAVQEFQRGSDGDPQLRY